MLRASGQWARGMMLAGAAGFLLAVAGCGRDDVSPSTPGATSPAPAAAAPEEVHLLFVYSSEKKKWMDEVTPTFNAAHHKTAGGKVITVEATAMGSGESVDATVKGEIHPDLLSPASAAFIKLANAAAKEKGEGDLLGSTENLVLSPVVIAMWKPMAEALGWSPGGKQNIGWSDVLALSRDPNGWASKGHPEWGTFRFGHTHPEYSNSGLISVIAETYAAAGKKRDLTAEDLAKPEVGAYLHDIEKSVVHYGSSTGFFADKMFANGPRYLSAAVMYESNVVDSYGAVKDPAFPVVAIYPKEGTFWSDHPVGVVQRPWVTPERQEAGRMFIKFLLAPEQQQKAMAEGFRPADVGMALAAPLDRAHGVEAEEPRTLLEVPSSGVISAMLDLWRQNKKHAEVVLVMDTSGSMQDDGKMANARAGADALVDLLSDYDTLSIVPFSTQTRWAATSIRMKTERAKARSIIDGLYPDGNTRLFNTVAEAWDYLQKHAAGDRISAVVVLTDGADTAKQMTLQGLLQHLQFDAETHTTRVFTIGYGADAQASELKKIAEQTQAKYFAGKPENIREVFKEIATFF